MSDQLTLRHLHLTEAGCFKEYLENTRLWGEVGNEAFAEHVRSVGAGTTPASVAAASDKPWCLYHSWLPQMMELTAAQATAISGLIQGVSGASKIREQQEWTHALADGWSGRH